MIPADGSGRAKLETRKFATLEAYAQATKQDQHSVLVDYDVFVKVPKLDAQGSRRPCSASTRRRISTSG